MATGAAVASANNAAATSSAYNAGVPAGSANTAAATSAAYGAGVATGAAAAGAAVPAPSTGTATVPASGTWVVGMAYASLPAGSAMINKDGATYYLNGNTWFKPSYGANGVFYTVVPTP